MACGHTQSRVDYSLFVKSISNKFTMVLVYVDDWMLTSNDLHEINHVKHLLHDRFTYKDLGDVKYFISMEVARSFKGIALF